MHPSVALANVRINQIAAEQIARLFVWANRDPNVLTYRLLFAPTLLLLSDVANAQTQQALTFNRQGMEAAARRDYAEAERDYRSAVEIYRNLGASYEAHLSITLFNLAETICGEGRWRESKEVFAESLALTRRALGPKHLRTVAAMNALGNVQMLMGDFDNAEAQFTEAISIGRELYPREIQLAYSLAGFSSLRLRQGNPEAALPYASEALGIAIEAEPHEGLDTALMYQNVGRIHRAAGRSERAVPLFRKARAIYERVNAIVDPRYATLLSDEGLALMDEGKLLAADADLNRAIRLLQPCSGCGFELAIARNNLGLLRFRQKKYAEAGDLLRKALEEEERYSPSDAIQIGKTKSALEQVMSALR
jgi:tetratricopeptide (TPR) repeat protein